MSGFFESLKRLIVGEPVFRPEDQLAGWKDHSGRAKEELGDMAPPQSEPQQPARPTTMPPEDGIVKGKASTFPVVVVKRTRTHVNGRNMDVYCQIANRSYGPIELEEIDLAGHSRQLGGALRAGEEREYLAYSGSRLSNEAHREAHLSYKTDSGDYFQSIYDVEYQYDPADKLYAVEELHFRGPIRDIYG